MRKWWKRTQRRRKRKKNASASEFARDFCDGWLIGSQGQPNFTSTICSFTLYSGQIIDTICFRSVHCLFPFSISVCIRSTSISMIQFAFDHAQRNKAEPLHHYIYITYIVFSSFAQSNPIKFPHNVCGLFSRHQCK